MKVEGCSAEAVNAASGSAMLGSSTRRSAMRRSAMRPSAMRRSAMRRSSTRGGAARRTALAFFLAVMVLLPGSIQAGTPTSATEVAAASGLTTTADARYVVDPDAHRVHVTVALAATNHLTDTKTRRYYFDRAFLAVPPGTTAFKVTSGGASPKATVTSHTATYTLVRLDFGKQLAAGATRTFTLTFDIADPGGAPTRPTRIGTSLVTFSAWGLGSDGATGGSVSVVFPKGFTVDVDAAGLGPASTDAAGNIVYSTGRLSNPLSFVAAFAADRPSAFVESTLRVPIGSDVVPVTIRSWPDDAAWTRRVGGLLTRGLPALSAAIGLPWTAARPLVVQEAVSRNATGFAGRYDPGSGTIQIAYYADPFVILHEAAHAWFDGRLLADRWATEGFASYYALQAATALKLKGVSGDVLTPDLEKVRVPLNGWDGPSADGSTSTVDDAEYAAALKVASEIAGRAGPGGLSAVWRSIVDGRAAYQPAGPATDVERTSGAPDWRGLVDLLRERANVDVTDLWAAWVVRPNEARLLTDRTAARARYDALLARAGGWRLPRVVRDTLRVWQYGQAGELFDAANRALDDRDAVATAAAAAGLSVPSAMQTDFEGAQGFAAASAEADAELAAIAAYREAASRRPGSPDVLQAIGLWNSQPEAVLAAAAAAFAAGDLHGTFADSSYAAAIWSSAAGLGRNRLLAVALSAATVLLATWLIIRWYRDRGRRRRRAMAVPRKRPVAGG